VTKAGLSLSFFREVFHYGVLFGYRTDLYVVAAAGDGFAA